MAAFNSSLYGLNNNGEKNPSIIIARVTKIILDRIDVNDQNNKDFKDLGEWGALGCINFSILYSSKTSSNKKYPNLIFIWEPLAIIAIAMIAFFIVKFLLTLIIIIILCNLKK